MYLLDRAAAERPASHTSTLLIRLIDDGEDFNAVCSINVVITNMLIIIDYNILTS